eukprot:352589-Chlamydomonas_euryale.AAC.2
MHTHLPRAMTPARRAAPSRAPSAPARIAEATQRPYGSPWRRGSGYGDAAAGAVVCVALPRVRFDWHTWSRCRAVSGVRLQMRCVHAGRCSARERKASWAVLVPCNCATRATARCTSRGEVDAADVAARCGAMRRCGASAARSSSVRWPTLESSLDLGKTGEPSRRRARFSGWMPGWAHTAHPRSTQPRGRCLQLLASAAGADAQTTGCAGQPEADVGPLSLSPIPTPPPRDFREDGGMQASGRVCLPTDDALPKSLLGCVDSSSWTCSFVPACSTRGRCHGDCRSFWGAGDAKRHREHDICSAMENQCPGAGKGPYGGTHGGFGTNRLASPMSAHLCG